MTPDMFYLCSWEMNRLNGSARSAGSSSHSTISLLPREVSTAGRLTARPATPLGTPRFIRRSLVSTAPVARLSLAEIQRPALIARSKRRSTSSRSLDRRPLLRTPFTSRGANSVLPSDPFNGGVTTECALTQTGDERISSRCTALRSSNMTKWSPDRVASAQFAVVSRNGRRLVVIDFVLTMIMKLARFGGCSATTATGPSDCSVMIPVSSRRPSPTSPERRRFTKGKGR